MAWQFERVAGPFSFTEGPAYDGRGILFADIPNDRIMHYCTPTGGLHAARTERQGRIV